MCSSFYGQAPLPAAGHHEENIMISEEEEDERQHGDLADMVRSSSVNHRLRRGSDDIYPQDVSAVCSSNHHHQNNMIWSLTGAASAAADDETCVDHNRNSTTSSSSCQECCLLDDDHNIIVEYMQAAAAATTEVADDPFTATAYQHHPLHTTNNHYNIDMFLSPQHELLHLPLITTTSSGGCGFMKSFNSKSGAAAQEAQDHRQRANQTSYLHSSTTTCPANSYVVKDNTASAAPPTVAYVTSIITDHGRHTSSASSHVSSWQLPPINCNVFSQKLHISSSTNVDMLAPPSSIMVQQQHPQQASSTSLALASAVGSGSGNDHITSNYSRHSSGSMPAEMLLINEDQNRINCTATASASGCDSTLLHISSSPSNPAIKRRKCQSKKVVCIPAPTPANSRPSGEVVPSDLWAWRKYGQKPIKGSPYPRGYYRCSSSKGCSARKQVERSRTDPNMLVITYTSEHNHPWPTQRNALAGSIRSHPSKNSTCASNSSWTTGVVLNDQILKTSTSIGSDELKPDETGMIKQQKVLDDHVVDASVQVYSNDHDQREDNSKGDNELEDEHYWRCSYKKMSSYSYRSRTTDRPEEHNEQSVQEDFFGELGDEMAGKDHNGFSSFLMDYSASDKAVYMKHAS